MSSVDVGLTNVNDNDNHNFKKTVKCSIVHNTTIERWRPFTVLCPENMLPTPHTPPHIPRDVKTQNYATYYPKLQRTTRKHAQRRQMRASNSLLYLKVERYRNSGALQNGKPGRKHFLGVRARIFGEKKSELKEDEGNAFR